MTIWMALTFAAFLVLVITIFFSFRKIRRLMIDRHPDRFPEMQRKAWFPHRALHSFILFGDHADLRDPHLSHEIRNFRWLNLGAFASWLVYAGVLIAAR